MRKNNSMHPILILALLVPVLTGLSLRSPGATETYTPLSDEQMRTITGGDGCGGCRYAGERLDECYHLGYADDCATDMCIANYAIESTCDPGDGTCTAELDPNEVSAVQYKRQDVDCYTENPWDWNIWFTHYFGSDCNPSDGTVRCEKIYTYCDGTLLATGAVYNGIVCR